MIENKIILGIPIDTKKEFYYYPLKYKDFLEISEKNYIMLLNFLKEIINPLPNKNKLNKTLLTSSTIEVDNGITLLYLLLKFLKYVLKVKKIEIDNDKYLWCDEILINNKNFDTVLKIAIIEYDLLYNEEDENKYNPKDKKAEEIIKKLQKSNKKIEEQKNMQEEDVTVSNRDLLLKTCYDLKIEPNKFKECSMVYCKKMIEMTYKQTVINAALSGADLEKTNVKDLF